jgi:hypothetical protein
MYKKIRLLFQICTVANLYTHSEFWKIPSSASIAALWSRVYVAGALQDSTGVTLGSFPLIVVVKTKALEDI